MKDGIIKADGTSRLARSVANFKNKYPTYDAFATALVDGTLPLDILFNEAGWSQLPDFLNQANLLKAATAALYEKDNAAVPDDIFAMIPGLLGQKLQMNLLWENASPTSVFNAQTVSVDLSGYDMIAIQVYSAEKAYDGAKALAGGKLFFFSLSGSGVFHLSDRYLGLKYEYSKYSVAVYSFDRTVSVVNGGLAFSDCSTLEYTNKQVTGVDSEITSIWGGYGIPTHIYGIKGVQA